MARAIYIWDYISKIVYNNTYKSCIIYSLYNIIRSYDILKMIKRSHYIAMSNNITTFIIININKHLHNNFIFI